MPAEKQPKEDRDVLLSRRLHLSKFPGGCLFDIRIHCLVLVAHCNLWRPVQASRHLGWGKALWVIGLVLFSYLGVLVYLITQGRGMAERNAQQAQQAREDLRRVVGYSVADEITKLDQLKKSGSITADEYGRLRARLV